MVTPERTGVIETIADEVERRKQEGSPLLVAIDGIDGSGKSTFADELAIALRDRAMDTVRSTIDSFHNPRAIRMARGTDSPIGFYLDSHDLEALETQLLEPFARGAGEYRIAVFDAPTDSPVVVEPARVKDGDTLILDGIFLQRPELADYWDFVVFLDGQVRVNMRRLEHVMQDLPTDPVDVVGHVLTWQRRIDRYASGMRYYLDLVDPMTMADVMIDNNDLAKPRIVKAASDG